MPILILFYYCLLYRFSILFFFNAKKTEFLLFALFDFLVRHRQCHYHYWWYIPCHFFRSAPNITFVPVSLSLSLCICVCRQFLSVWLCTHIWFLVCTCCCCRHQRKWSYNIYNWISYNVYVGNEQNKELASLFKNIALFTIIQQNLKSFWEFNKNVQFNKISTPVWE